MPQRRFRPFAVIAFALALLLSLASKGLAQIDNASNGIELRRAKTWFEGIVQRVENKENEKLRKMLEGFQLDMLYVNDYLNRASNKLDDTDKEWISEAKTRATKPCQDSASYAADYANGTKKLDSFDLKKLREHFVDCQSAITRFSLGYNGRMRGVEEEMKKEKNQSEAKEKYEKLRKRYEKVREDCQTCPF